MFPEEVGHVNVHPLSNPKKVREFLSQHRYWVNATRAQIRIRDMDSEYLFSTMLWLLKRAIAVKFTMEMYYAAKGADDEKLAELRGMSAEVFIRQTPLFNRMETRYLELAKEEEFIIPRFNALVDSDDDEGYDHDGNPY
jgi:hypothetical protein